MSAAGTFSSLNVNSRESVGGALFGTVLRIESKSVFVKPIGHSPAVHSNDLEKPAPIESSMIQDAPSTAEPHGKIIMCVLRGKFKKELRIKKDKLITDDLVAVGDVVTFLPLQDGTGVITEIHERKNFISRKAGRQKGYGYRGERLEQVIASNIDMFFIVDSLVSPPFNNKSVDRFLVAGESAQIPSVIIINKIDLDENGEDYFWKELYESIGYTVLLTSTVTGDGISELKTMLRNKRSLFWGHSGVGKSSLYNAVFPHLKLLTGEISDYSNRGKHTTVTVSMHEGEADTFIIDTPGIREIDPFGISKINLSYYFLEFAPFIKLCKYNTCTHDHEPGCAVAEAAQSGEITPERYDSYLRLLATIEQDMIFEL